MSPEQVELIIRNAFGAEAERFLLLSLILGGIITLVAAFLGTYLQTKGRHLALREDIHILTAQVMATTKATEEIKAQIGQSTWVGQKRWELKRELYTDLMKALYRVLHINETVFDIYLHEQRASTEEIRDRLDKRGQEMRDQEQPYLDELIRVRGIGELILSRDTIEALDELNKAWTDNRYADSYWEFIDARVSATRKAHEKLIVTAKRDLEL